MKGMQFPQAMSDKQDSYSSMKFFIRLPPSLAQVVRNLMLRATHSLTECISTGENYSIQLLLRHQVLMASSLRDDSGRVRSC